MDLVNQFVYSMVLYLLARNESFHEISASSGSYRAWLRSFVTLLCLVSVACGWLLVSGPGNGALVEVMRQPMYWGYEDRSVGRCMSFVCLA